MSEFRFTDGNLIILYAQFSSENGQLPIHIDNRVRTCVETYNMVVKSKPDGNKTMIVIVASADSADTVKQAIVSAGIDGKIVAADTESHNMTEAISHIYELIKSRPNPPFVYFVSSYWLHDIFASTINSKMRGIRVQFYGSIDQRSVEEIEAEKARDLPKKGAEYYKQKAKSRALDILLNVIFPD